MVLKTAAHCSKLKCHQLIGLALGPPRLHLQLIGSALGFSAHLEVDSLYNLYRVHNWTCLLPNLTIVNVKTSLQKLSWWAYSQADKPRVLRFTEWAAISGVVYCGFVRLHFLLLSIVPAFASVSPETGQSVLGESMPMSMNHNCNLADVAFCFFCLSGLSTAIHRVPGGQAVRSLLRKGLVCQVRRVSSRYLLWCLPCVASKTAQI